MSGIHICHKKNVQFVEWQSCQISVCQHVYEFVRSIWLVSVKKVFSGVTDLSMLKTVCCDSPVALATLSCTLLRKIDCCCFSMSKKSLTSRTMYFVCEVSHAPRPRLFPTFLGSLDFFFFLKRGILVDQNDMPIPLKYTH